MLSGMIDLVLLKNAVHLFLTCPLDFAPAVLADAHHACRHLYLFHWQELGCEHLMAVCISLDSWVGTSLEKSPRHFHNFSSFIYFLPHCLFLCFYLYQCYCVSCQHENSMPCILHFAGFIFKWTLDPFLSYSTYFSYVSWAGDLSAVALCQSEIP